MENPQKPSDRIIIFDTTLRDGEQSPGATMSLKEKIAVATMLDSMGVDVIEAGFAASSAGDAACITLIHDQQQANGQSFARLNGFNTHQNGPGDYRANVEMDIDGQPTIVDAAGDGPLDAIFQAISRATNHAPTLHSFEVHSVSQGTDAQAEAVITLKQDGQFFTGHARDTDTMMASARAYVGSINKIMAQKAA